VTSFDEIPTEVTERAVSTLTASFRQFAVKLGWPSSAANAVSIKITADGAEYDIQPSAQTQVDNLEYGDGTRPPMRAMFNFAPILNDVLTDALNDAYSDSLFGSGVF